MKKYSVLTAVVIGLPAALTTTLLLVPYRFSPLISLSNQPQAATGSPVSTEPDNSATPTPGKHSSGWHYSHVICPYCGTVRNIAQSDRNYYTYTCSSCGHAYLEGAGTSPSEAPSPAETPATTPSSDQNPAAGNSVAAVDAALQKLDLGQIAFTVPEVLPLKQHATVVLLLSPTQNANELTATLRQESNQGDKIESARIHLSGLMEAKLVGPAFEIHSITPEEPQMVSRTEATEWKWDVEPKLAGNQSLHLTINAIVKFDGANRSRTIRSFDRMIRVQVPASSFSGMSNLVAKWRFMGLVIFGSAGAIGLVIWIRRKRRASKPPTFSSEASSDGGNDLFVSYSRHDQKRVLAIAKLLEDRGLRVWIDQKRLDGATIWRKELTEALLRAKVFVLLLSQASVKSVNVMRELSLASEEGKEILPVQLEEVEIPSTFRYQLAGIQYLVLDREKSEANADQIMQTLAKLGIGPNCGEPSPLDPSA